MLESILRALFPAHPQTTLALRGRAIRTFGSLTIVLTLALLFLGIYLIAGEFTNPIASGSLGLFIAAVVLATAMTLLLELSQLFRGTHRNVRLSRAALVSDVNLVARAGRRAAGPALGYRPSLSYAPRLPYQRCYVDRVRVRA